MTTGIPRPDNYVLKDDRREEIDRRSSEGEQVSPPDDKRSGTDRRSGVDQRNATRLSCRIPGSLKVNGSHVEDCVIKDMSEIGMQIYMRAGLWLPSKFQVEASPFKQPVTVAKKWSSRDVVGVRFVTKDDSA